ncbi:MAG: hypothetical protein KAR06_04785 [Deltaproteobacteria bacterium]|nr:hypothetical protein [Deltaproteobacteria bacterium]
MNKKWYQSKTLRVNLLVFVGSLISGFMGEDWLDGEAQLMILSILEFGLRLITNTGVTRK